ncbi:polyamine-modulated factor 1 [Strongylocentrotus purpuratus]|uniref:Polyamine-modulated factor 1 n=1 Tax=Strongylocentrotus purpuratus TaxID=7668 RepID=A0A7M7N7C6_STRPU|nr:polyamine-modulated factor 1 [Strongylocentrotus purpuratus]
MATCKGDSEGDKSLVQNQDEKQVIANESSVAGDPPGEPDGARMMHLRDALRKTIQKCIDSAKFSTFNRHYGKHMADRNPQALKSLLQQFKEQLEKSIKEEIELMIDEENLVHLFNELDKLIDGTSNEGNPVAWRPSGEPEKDCQRQVYKEKLKEKEKLERVLQEVEAEGSRLQEVIKGQRQKLGKTQMKINHQLEAFNQAAASCDQVPITELEKVLHQLCSSIPAT